MGLCLKPTAGFLPLPDRSSVNSGKQSGKNASALFSSPPKILWGLPRKPQVPFHHLTGSTPANPGRPKRQWMEPAFRSLLRISRTGPLPDSRGLSQKLGPGFLLSRQDVSPTRARKRYSTKTAVLTLLPGLPWTILSPGSHGALRKSELDFPPSQQDIPQAQADKKCRKKNSVLPCCRDSRGRPFPRLS